MRFRNWINWESIWTAFSHFYENLKPSTEITLETKHEVKELTKKKNVYLKMYGHVFQF